MSQAQANHPTPQSWIDAIARGEADLAAGRVSEIDIEALCQEIEAEADALEAARSVAGPPSAA